MAKRVRTPLAGISLPHIADIISSFFRLLPSPLRHGDGNLLPAPDLSLGPSPRRGGTIGFLCLSPFPHREVEDPPLADGSRGLGWWGGRGLGWGYRERRPTPVGVPFTGANPALAKACGYNASLRMFALLLVVGLLLIGSGCEQLPGFAAPTPTPTVRPSKSLTPPTTVVKRGSIVESVKVLGRVTAMREAELSFKNAGKLKGISVQPGQEVADGQVVAELDTGDLQTRLAGAQVSYDTAKIKLDQMRANKGSAELRRKLDLANAAAAIQQAEAALVKAESDLAAVKAGPTPVDTAEAAVKDAQMAVDSARRNLASVQKTTAKNINDRQNEANWYEANFGNYLARYSKGEIGKQELDRQWENLAAAKDRLEAAKTEAIAAIATAESQVGQAEDKLRKAQAELESKKALPPDWHIKQAEQTVQMAQLNLEKARMDYEQKQASGDDFDIALQEKAVEQAKTTLDEINAQLADAKLVAPFAGKVMVARGKTGDQITALQPVVSISDPKQLQVRGDLIDADIPKIALGQEVSITIDSMPGLTLKGTVVGIPGNFASQAGTIQDRSVQIRVDWPAQLPPLGMLARINITVQKKDNVLIVPAKAVKTVGKRRFVEHMEGTIRRSSNVEVGIVTDTEAEIINGVTEGQTILAGQ